MLKINKDKCIGCASCVDTNGEIFKMDEDSKAVIRYQPCAEMREQIEDVNFAIKNCPNNAIELK